VDSRLAPRAPSSISTFPRPASPVVSHLGTPARAELCHLVRVAFRPAATASWCDSRREVPTWANSRAVRDGKTRGDLRGGHVQSA